MFLSFLIISKPLLYSSKVQERIKMESFGSFSNEEWHSLAMMFSTDEMSDQCGLGLNFEIPNILLSVSDESSNFDSFEHLVNASDDVNPNFQHFFSKENSFSGSDASNNTISPSYESFPYCPSNIILPSSNDVCDQSINIHKMNEANNSCLPYLAQDVASLVSSRETPIKRKHETPDSRYVVDDEVKNQKTKNTAKRIRVSRENVSLYYFINNLCVIVRLWNCCLIIFKNMR